MHCPHCEQKIRVRPEYFGKRVKCPGCGERFIVDPETEEPMVVGQVDEVGEEGRQVRKRRPAPAREEDEEEERPRRRRPAPEEEEEQEEEADTRVTRRRPTADDEIEGEEQSDAEEESPRRKGRANKAAWRKVRTGLTIILVSIAVSFVVGLLIGAVSGAMGVAAGAAAGANKQQPTPPSPLIGAIGGIVGLLLQISNLVGVAFCAAAPPKRGARMLAVVALCLAAIGFLLGLGQTALNLTESPPPAGDGHGPPASPAGGVLLGASLLIGMLHFFVFLLFLRAVAIVLGREGLGASLVINMVLVGVCVFLLAAIVLALAIGLAAGPRGAGGFMAAVGGVCLLLVVVAAAGIMYLVNLVRVRAALSARIRR